MKNFSLAIFLKSQNYTFLVKTDRTILLTCKKYQIIQRFILLVSYKTYKEAFMDELFYDIDKLAFLYDRNRTCGVSKYHNFLREFDVFI